MAVSYNKTYKSKSKSSANKIKYEEIVEILENIGETKSFYTTYEIKGRKYKEALLITKKIEFYGFGRFPSGQAFRCNLFVKNKKDFHFNP